MSNEVVAAIVAAVFSLLSVLLSIATRISLDRGTKRDTRKTLMERYRGPFIHAVYNLQSRLAKILTDKTCLNVVDPSADGRERSYFIGNTAFVVAQYMAWAEIIRREISHLDMGELRKSRRFSILLDDMYGHWQAEEWGKTLRLFAGEQRAIGDAMIVRSEDYSNRHVLGYGEFIDRVDSMPFIREFRDELYDVNKIRQAFGRLGIIQNELVDLLDILDPELVYFPNAKRAKIDTACVAATSATVHSS